MASIRTYNSFTMVSAYTFPNFLLQIALGCSLLAICFGVPNAVITPGIPVMEKQVVISEVAVLALGFFSPGKSTNRYVGTLYARSSCCCLGGKQRKTQFQILLAPSSLLGMAIWWSWMVKTTPLEHQHNQNTDQHRQ